MSRLHFWTEVLLALGLAALVAFLSVMAVVSGT